MDVTVNNTSPSYSFSVYFELRTEISLQLHVATSRKFKATVEFHSPLDITALEFYLENSVSVGSYGATAP